jgi:hypothetical protein
MSKQGQRITLLLLHLQALVVAAVAEETQAVAAAAVARLDHKLLSDITL